MVSRIVAAAGVIMMATVGLASTAHAQKGSRLCGLAFGTTGIFIEVKQPKGKSARNSTNKFCKKVRDGIRGGLKDKGVQNADSWTYYERSECEGTAGALSGQRSRADICDQMKRSDVRNQHIYQVQYDVKSKSFSVVRQ